MKSACLPKSKGWIPCLVDGKPMSPNSIRNKATSPNDAHLEWAGTQLTVSGLM